MISDYMNIRFIEYSFRQLLFYNAKQLPLSTEFRENLIWQI